VSYFTFSAIYRYSDGTGVASLERQRLDRRDFLPLIRAHPDLAIKIIEVLCTRLRHTSEQVKDIVFLDLPGRRAKALLRLADNGDGSSKTPKIAITQKEIGQIIGMSRESTNKQLRDWERRKWIRFERGGVILQRGVLSELAEAGGQPEGD